MTISMPAGTRTSKLVWLSSRYKKMIIDEALRYRMVDLNKRINEVRVSSNCDVLGS